MGIHPELRKESCSDHYPVVRNKLRPTKSLSSVQGLCSAISCPRRKPHKTLLLPPPLQNKKSRQHIKHFFSLQNSLNGNDYTSASGPGNKLSSFQLNDINNDGDNVSWELFQLELHQSSSV